MEDQRNLVLAIVLTMVILFGYNWLMAPTPEELAQQAALEQAQTSQSATPGNTQTPGNIGIPEATIGTSGGIPGSGIAETPLRREEAIAGDARVPIISEKVSGSLRLRGGRIDDLTLLDYRVSKEKDAANVVLLSPAGAENAYYADFGWAAYRETPVKTPGPTSVWSPQGDQLSPDHPLTLTWDNGEGLVFSRTYTLDEHYLISVTQAVTNATGEEVLLQPYGLIKRVGTPKTSGFFILHEGPIGVFDDSLEEIDYTDLQETPQIDETSIGGWLGITDKYWLMALIPDQTQRIGAQFRYRRLNGNDQYQTSMLGEGGAVPTGTTLSSTSYLFAGAKVSELIDHYEEELGVARFDRAIDWGWFYFLTKPIFWLLDAFNSWIGNFGVAILLLTVLIKVLFFQLANKSYVSMSAMRKLQPKMTAIREKYADDKQRQQQEMMALYQKEKVNPVSGCLPMLIQIPVFFALYKVLFVSIEMRHAPFFGWVQDLSAPDPLLVTTLFGLIPWDPPSFLAIGVWPLAMGLSMWAQQKLNPAPPDPMQAKIFMLMPIMFTFLLASFPVGLVIYWTWNNLLTIGQQYVIMKRHGAFDE